MQRRGRAPRPILLVDDIADTREMYESYLRIAGYGVETANDGRQAVRFARATRRDLIVMDLQMPAAIRQLQSDPTTASIPVVVLTGHDLKDYLKHCAFAEGAAAYLTKPLLPEQLAREITVRLTDHPTLRRRAV